MKTLVHLCMLVALVPLEALPSENTVRPKGKPYDITRQQSSLENTQCIYAAEVYVASSKKWTTVISHVATLDTMTKRLIKQSYQGYTVSTTARKNSSVESPKKCFYKLKKRWECAVKKRVIRNET